MSKDQLHSLIEKYITGQCTPEEIKTLRSLLYIPEYAAELRKIMDEQLAENIHTSDDFPDVVSRITSVIELEIQQQNKTRIDRQLRFFKRWSIAASFLAVLFISAAFLIFYSPENNSIVADNGTSNDILPATEGAILTLDDGRTVVLDSLGNGLVAIESGARIILRDGQLSYNTDGTPIEDIGHNTITTPKGKQFQLQLPDGSKVWMNAGSSLRYPTAFVGNERKVEMSGEVYFEVAKNAKKPFHVQVNDKIEIEVLGTHFNINSYLNESIIKTTLLEGSVRVLNGKEKATIKPGEQAQITEQRNKITVVRDVDIEKVMAWKNGVFNFQDVSLAEVMRQLERWYNIEVVFEKNVPDLEFYGKLRRDLALSEVLRGLELSEVRFKIEEGRKVIVMQ